MVIVMDFVLKTVIASIIITLVSSAPTKEIDCLARNGSIPVEVFNSKYTILPNGLLCCPRYSGDSNCQDVKDTCGERELVKEPCHHCKTCSKLLGEDCGGPHSIYGKCGSNLVCSRESNDLIGACVAAGGPSVQQVGQICGGRLDSLGICVEGSVCIKNDKSDGICVMEEKTKEHNEVCGGAYGELGRCADHYRCSVDEDEFLKGANISGICYSNNSQGACFKNCSSRATVPVCGTNISGTNSTWFQNGCFLRQSNCHLILPRQYRFKIRKTPREEICGELPLAFRPKMDPSTTSQPPDEVTTQSA